MSQLVGLLSKLKESGAERIFYAPGEVGYAYDGDAKRPIGESVRATTIVEAIAEVLSYDELRDLPDNRPRIVRHEHAGEGYILEVVRQSSGVALGIRFAPARPVREPTFRDATRDSNKEAAPKLKELPRTLSRRFRPSANKLQALKAARRTVRVELDDEGNPIDPFANDPPARPPRVAPHEPAAEAKTASPVHTLDTKRVQRPVAGAAPSAERILQTMLGLDPLADLPRTGWVLRGVRPCESIADHSFGVAFLAMLFVDAIRAEGGAIDGERTLRMALVHDAAEARTGDVPMPNKTPRMTEALHELESTLVRELLPPGQHEVWADVEHGESLEARVVKAADKAQMMIKALAYERQKRGQLDEFWSNARNFDDRGVAVARELFAALAAAAGRELPAATESR